MNYYNDNDPKIAAWLRELIGAGLIPKGDVDERSIVDVKPHEIYHYTQHHFFAGIAGWPLALQFSNWPEDQLVWTGSCPCQPLSCAGQRKGHADQRHLWPAFYALIAECRPTTVFGEQVAGPDGREWLAGVRTDLEGAGYAVGAADLCAAGVGAPHPRQRLYWVAHARHALRRQSGQSEQENQNSGELGNGGEIIRLGDTDINRHHNGKEYMEGNGSKSCEYRETVRHGSWSNYEIVHCLDGKSRRFEPGTFPLAHGVSGRVGLLRGYGNAIVPQVAAEFIMAAMESF